MSKSLERRAQRFVRAGNRQLPKIQKHEKAIVRSGNRLTDFDNANGGEQSLGRQINVARLAGSVAVHWPLMMLRAGRLAVAARPFEVELEAARPEVVAEIEELGLYDIAAEIAGTPPKDLDRALEAAGLPNSE